MTNTTTTDNDANKKSAKGLLRVDMDPDGNFNLYDQQTSSEENTGRLETIFYNGKLIREQSLQDIKSILWD